MVVDDPHEFLEEKWDIGRFLCVVERDADPEIELLDR